MCSHGQMPALVCVFKPARLSETGNSSRSNRSSSIVQAEGRRMVTMEIEEEEEKEAEVGVTRIWHTGGAEPVTPGRFNLVDSTAVVASSSLANWEQPTGSRSIYGGPHWLFPDQPVLQRSRVDLEGYWNALAWLVRLHGRPVLVGSGPNRRFTHLHQAWVIMDEVRKLLNPSPEALLLLVKPLLAAAGAVDNSAHSPRSSLDVAQDGWQSVVALSQLSSQMMSRILHCLYCTLQGPKTCVRVPTKILIPSSQFEDSVEGRILRAGLRRSAVTIMEAGVQNTLRLETDDLGGRHQLEAPSTVPDGDRSARETGEDDHPQEAKSRVGSALGCTVEVLETSYDTRKQQQDREMVLGDCHVIYQKRVAKDFEKVEVNSEIHDVQQELRSSSMIREEAVQDSPAADVSGKRSLKAHAGGLYMKPQEKQDQPVCGPCPPPNCPEDSDDVIPVWSAKGLAVPSGLAVECEALKETLHMENLCSSCYDTHVLCREVPVPAGSELHPAVICDAVPVEGASGAVDDGNDDSVTVNDYATLLSNLGSQFLATASPEASSPASSSRRRRKRKKEASAELPAPGSEADFDELGTQCRAEKKVRFSLGHNIVWTPPNSLPPLSKRTPPSATPRGSALKIGVLPGPICEEPVICKIKRSSKSVRRTKSPGMNQKTKGGSSKKLKDQRPLS